MDEIAVDGLPYIRAETITSTKSTTIHQSFHTSLIIIYIVIIIFIGFIVWILSFRLNTATFTPPDQFQPPNRVDGVWYDTFVPLSDDTPPRFSRGVRGVIVSVFGPGQSSWLKTNWVRNERNLFHPMKDEMDYLLYYTIWPNNQRDELIQTMDAIGGFTKIHNDLYERSPTLHTKFDLYGTDKWISQLGVTVYTAPLATNLPRYLMHNPGLLEDPEWLQCVGWRLGIDYIMLSGAVWPWQLWYHPLVNIGYEYWLKLDLDVVFHSTIPEPIFSLMQKKQCKFLHTLIKHDEINCSQGSRDAVLNYSISRRVIPASAHQSWYNDETWMAYGNTMAVSLDWAASIETHDLTEYLYENVDGFFHHRWTDQQISLRTFAQYFDVPSVVIREPGGGDMNNMCDLSSWRGKIFNHKN